MARDARPRRAKLVDSRPMQTNANKAGSSLMRKLTGTLLRRPREESQAKTKRAKLQPSKNARQMSLFSSRRGHIQFCGTLVMLNLNHS